MKKKLILSMVVAAGVVACEGLPTTVEAARSSIQSEQIDMYRGADSDYIWVKRDGAELKDGYRSSSTVITTLKEGDQLELLSKRGTKYEVRTSDGQEGFISRLQITEKKPKSSLGNVTLVTSDDMAPEERSNIRAIRGLTPAAEQYAETAEVPQEAVDSAIKMEKISEAISDTDVEKFLQEGGVEQ